VLPILICLSVATPVFSGEFKVYPGAKVDQQATQELEKAKSQAPGMTAGLEASFYATGDSFDKVYAFYKASAREYKMPGRAGAPRKLSSGQELRQAFFIFDDAEDLAGSKLWIKIQRPYLSLAGETRDVTAIAVSRKK
jgi:hypothetical protein